MTNYKQKLRECRSCAEAKPIMEAMGMGASQQQLMDYYYQLRVSKDPRQQAHGENAYATAIREADEENHKNNNHQEMEDNHNNDKMHEANGGLHRDQGGEADIAGIIKDGKHQEADEITGELDSHQSSDIDMPYPQEGKDTPNSDIESMQSATGENQMGGIKEGMNGMNGMPPMPQPGMPPMAPEVQQAMAPKMPQMPQMNTPMAMRQMQYTVDMNNKRLFNRVINPLIREVKKLREANIALDKKVQETQSNAGSMKLNLDKIRENSPVREHRFRETIPGTSIEAPEMTHPRAELENKRYEIAQLDKELAKAKPNFYQ